MADQPGFWSGLASTLTSSKDGAPNITGGLNYLVNPSARAKTQADLGAAATASQNEFQHQRDIMNLYRQDPNSSVAPQLQQIALTHHEQNLARETGTQADAAQFSLDQTKGATKAFADQHGGTTPMFGDMLNKFNQGEATTKSLQIGNTGAAQTVGAAKKDIGAAGGGDPTLHERQSEFSANQATEQQRLAQEKELALRGQDITKSGQQLSALGGYGGILPYLDPKFAKHAQEWIGGKLGFDQGGGPVMDGSTTKPGVSLENEFRQGKTSIPGSPHQPPAPVSGETYGLPGSIPDRPASSPSQPFPMSQDMEQLRPLYQSLSQAAKGGTGDADRGRAVQNAQYQQMLAALRKHLSQYTPSQAKVMIQALQKQPPTPLQ